MSVQIRLNPRLRPFAGGEAVVEAGACRTLGDCLAELERRHPGIRGELWGERGGLRDCYLIHLNGRLVLSRALDTAVAEGDVVELLYVMSGG